MADYKRQQIMDALDTRLKTITQANGYETDAGLHVFDWLDRDLADSELDAIIYKDVTNEIEPGTMHDYGNKIIVEIKPKTKAAENTAKQLRKINGDVYKAIGTGDQFGGLAIDSQPVKEEMNVRQSDKISGSATLTIAIEYTTDKWGY